MIFHLCLRRGWWGGKKGAEELGLEPPEISTSLSHSRSSLSSWRGGHRTVPGTSPTCLGWQHPPSASSLPALCSLSCLLQRPQQEAEEGEGGRSQGRHNFKILLIVPPMLPKKWPFTTGPVNPLRRGNPRECGVGG